METEFILYVADQERSKLFYSSGLGLTPSLDVPGMTEFELGTHCKLGLMPEKNINKILSGKTADPSGGNGIPRCELYLKYQKLEPVYLQFVKAGAKLISEPLPRDWGDTVAYLADPDGHIVALAQRS
jgi:predicted enzyme related to lactoylglutathione lyase